MGDVKISALPVATSFDAATDVICTVIGGVTSQITFASLFANITITGGSIDGVIIGGHTPLSASFTTLSTYSTCTLASIAEIGGVAPIGDGNTQFGLLSVTTRSGIIIATNPSQNPCPDGTVSPVTTITTLNGIITAIS